MSLIASATLVALSIAPARAATAPPAAPRAALREDAFDRKKAQLEAARLPALEALVTFCHEGKAFAERDNVYALILLLNEEHADARKWLRYKKDRKSGEWTQKGYREPRATKDEAVVAEYARRLAALDVEFVAGLYDLVIAKKADIGPDRARAEFEGLMALAPNHAGVREALGYERIERDGEEVWLPATAVKALKRRGESKSKLRELREAAPEFGTADPVDPEEGFGVGFETVYTADHVRVLGATDPAELGKIMRNAQVQWDLLRWMTKTRFKEPEGLRIFVMASNADKKSFLSQNPDFSSDDRRFALKLTSLWLRNYREYVCWHKKSKNRIDAACKQTSSYYLSQAHGVYQQGWLAEGFGLYVTKLMCGARENYSIVEDEYDDPGTRDLERDYKKPNANWYALAVKMLEKSRPTRLVSALGKDSNTMNWGDYVLGYTLTAYLIEGHDPRVLRQIMNLISEYEKEPISSVAALEKVLGAKMPDIQKDLLAWARAVGKDSL